MKVVFEFTDEERSQAEDAFRGTDREVTGVVLALEEAWYSAIGCFMLGGITS